jgi:hypothetical protein
VLGPCVKSFRSGRRCFERCSLSRQNSFARLRLAALMMTLLALAVVPHVHAATLPSGFSEKTVFTGLSQPTAGRFSPDGRVFVAEKSGVIKEFDSLTDTTHRVSETPS